MTILCNCKKGHASDYDKVCRYCRELEFSRAKGKSVGVAHRGDGMSVDAKRVLLGEVKRKDVYL